jgi:hypothetical protein
VPRQALEVDAGDLRGQLAARCIDGRSVPFDQLVHSVQV